MDIVKIKDLNIGEQAEIVGYEAGDPRYRSKLLSMGLTKRAVVRLTKTAPLGDPVEIEVRGFRLSLRKDEADVLLLRRIDFPKDSPHPGAVPTREGVKESGIRRMRRRWGRLFGGGRQEAK